MSAAIVLIAMVVVSPGVPAADGELQIYAVAFQMSAGFVEEREIPTQPGMEEHVVFITGLHDRGVVPLAGPLLDGGKTRRVSGLLYFVRAASAQEAREIAMREPLVRTGVVEIESVREFLVGVGTECME